MGAKCTCNRDHARHQAQRRNRGGQVRQGHQPHSQALRWPGHPLRGPCEDAAPPVDLQLASPTFGPSKPPRRPTTTAPRVQRPAASFPVVICICPVRPQAVIAQKVVSGIYSGVTTSKLDELAAETGEPVLPLHGLEASPCRWPGCEVGAAPRADVFTRGSCRGSPRGVAGAGRERAFRIGQPFKLETNSTKRKSVGALAKRTRSSARIC